MQLLLQSASTVRSGAASVPSLPVCELSVVVVTSALLQVKAERLGDTDSLMQNAYRATALKCKDDIVPLAEQFRRTSS